MNYCSKTTHESKTCPGVSFSLKKMTERRRILREMTVADLRTKVNEGSAAIKTAMENIDNTMAGGLDKLNRDFAMLLHAEWYPAWIRWGVASIENLDIDGKPATIETLIESAPTELLEEIFLTILKESGLSTVEEKNSELLTTSADQVDGRTSDSTATGVTLPESGKTATAPSSTPAT